MRVDVFVATNVQSPISLVPIGGAMPKPAISERPNYGIEPKSFFECFSDVAARVMLLHVNSPFVTLTMPPDDSTRRGGNFIQ